MNQLVHFVLTHAGAVAVTALALTVTATLTGGMVRLSRQRRPAPFRLHRDEAGGLAEEMVLIFPLFLLILCLTVQFVLMLNARLMVNYAAFLAGRSASVWIPRKTNAEPSNFIRLTEQSPSGCIVSGIFRSGDDPSEKLSRIRGAAALGCAPISPNYVNFCGRLVPFGAGAAGAISRIGIGILNSAPDSAQAAAALVARIPYSLDYTRVWFNDNQDSRQLIVPPQGDIKVTVEHDFFLVIPWAGRWIGKRYDFFGSRRNIWYIPVRESYTFRNEGEAVAPGW